MPVFEEDPVADRMRNTLFVTIVVVFTFVIVRFAFF